MSSSCNWLCNTHHESYQEGNYDGEKLFSLDACLSSSVQFPEEHRDVFAMTLRTHCANSLCVQADLPDDLKRVFDLS